MIPGFSGIAGLAFIAVMVASIRAKDVQRRADLATLGALIAGAIALNALGDPADDWLTALLWSASTFFAVKGALLSRRTAAEAAAPKHEEVR